MYEGAYELSRELYEGTTSATVTVWPGHEGDTLVLEALVAGAEVALSRHAPMFTSAGGGSAPLADPFVSRTPLRIVPGDGGRIRFIASLGGTSVSIGGSDHTHLQVGALEPGPA